MGKTRQKHKSKQRQQKPAVKAKAKQPQRRERPHEPEDELEDVGFSEDLHILMSKDTECGQYFVQLAHFPTMVTSGASPQEALANMGQLLEQAMLAA